MSRRPNKAEHKHLTAVAELGCVICRMPAEIHHVLRGKGMARKASHYESIPLCPRHHRHGGYGVAIHAGIDGWEAVHGTEDFHLEWVREQLAITA